MISSLGSYYADQRQEFPDLLDVISNLGCVGGRVLDVGCGCGFLGAALMKMGYEQVVGIEPNPSAARAAGKRLTRVINAPFPTNLVGGSGPFHMVVFADSLEHIADPWSALSEAHDLLAEDGHLVLSVPNVGHYSIIWGLLRGKWDYGDSGLLDVTHLRFFTPKSLRRSIRDAGFDVTTERAVLVKPAGVYGPAAWLVERCAPQVFVFQDIVVAKRRHGKDGRSPR